MSTTICTCVSYDERTGVIGHMGAAEVESWDEVEHLLRTDGYEVRHVADTLGYPGYTTLRCATREYGPGEFEVVYYLVGDLPDPENLEGLRDQLQGGLREMVDALPTFGGQEVRSRQLHGFGFIWSWDATRLLVGEDRDSLEIIGREDVSFS